MVIDDAGGIEHAAARDPAAELLIRVATGDQVALARLYDLLGARVYGLLLGPRGGRGEEDLQGVFLEVWESAGSFDPARDRGDAWVLAIAQRRVSAATRPAVTDEPPALSRREARELAARAETPGESDLVDRGVAPPLHIRSKVLNRIGDAAAQHVAAEGAVSVPTARSEPGPAPVPEPEHAVPAESGATSAQTAPPTEVVQAVQRRNWTRGVILGVVASVLLIGIGWGAAALAALWQQ